MQKDKYQVATVQDANPITGSGLTILVSGTTSIDQIESLPSGINGLDCGGTVPLGFATDSNWTTCDLTFVGWPQELNITTNTVLKDIYDNISDPSAPIIYQITGVVADAIYQLPPIIFNGIRYINAIKSTAQLTTQTVLEFILTPLWQGIHN